MRLAFRISSNWCRSFAYNNNGFPEHRQNQEVEWHSRATPATNTKRQSSELLYSPPIFAEKVLKILCPGMWRNLAHVQLGVTSMSTMAIISIVVIISIIVSRHFALQDNKMSGCNTCTEIIFCHRNMQINLHGPDWYNRPQYWTSFP